MSETPGPASADLKRRLYELERLAVTAVDVVSQEKAADVLKAVRKLRIDVASGAVR